jgi:hypothetical protein
MRCLGGTMSGSCDGGWALYLRVLVMQYPQQNTVALAPVCILMVLHDVHAIKIFRNSLHFPPSLVSHMEQRIS